jgi:hypothetical protein
MNRPPVSEITHDLQGINFPADKQHLVKYAKAKHASDTVLNALKDMPDQDYKTMAEVMRGYGKEIRQRPTRH